MVYMDDYQKQAIQTAIYPGKGEVTGLAYTALGLGEAGEVQGKVKKILRDCEGKITDEHRKAIAKELGDVLWYVAACSSEIGYGLDEVAQMNLTKLASRKARGVLGGSGDDR